MSEIKLTVDETKLMVISGQRLKLHATGDAQLVPAGGHSKETVGGVLRPNNGRSDEYKRD